ncbi:MAG: hypothetical protein M0T69_02110 [Deltaproteobacteria bacterium]|nr:hypothetical protein [Deltaproteobacteria bacterium]
MNAINEARKAANLTYDDLAAALKKTGIVASVGYLKQLGMKENPSKPSENLARALCHVLPGLEYEALRPIPEFKSASGE